jgi:hypothetical protein
LDVQLTLQQVVVEVEHHLTVVEQVDQVEVLMHLELQDQELHVKVMMVEMQVQMQVVMSAVVEEDFLLLEEMQQEIAELQEDQELLELVVLVYVYQVYFQEHLLVLLEAVEEDLLDQVVHQM